MTVTSQYRFFQGRLGYRGHVAELRLDHAPIDPLKSSALPGQAGCTIAFSGLTLAFF